MHTVIIDGKEYIEVNDAIRLIYGYHGKNVEQEELYKAIEKALGFKLFTWQKTFIERGVFRCYGKTTAEILQSLLDKDAEPLDFSKPPRNRQEHIFRDTFRYIWVKLKVAGIPMREVFWHGKDKRDYYKSTKNDRALRRESQDGFRASVLFVDEMHEVKND